MHGGLVAHSVPAVALVPLYLSTFTCDVQGHAAPLVRVHTAAGTRLNCKWP